jgi:hypothetical protein
MADKTEYQQDGVDLTEVIKKDQGRDDLLAMILAARRLPSTNLKHWVPMAGPLPPIRSERDALLAVVNRGMEEVGAYLTHLGLMQ